MLNFSLSFKLNGWINLIKLFNYQQLLSYYVRTYNLYLILLNYYETGFTS